MNSDAFVYWLSGYVEIEDQCPTEEQWEIIKDRLFDVTFQTSNTRPNALLNDLPKFVNEAI